MQDLPTLLRRVMEAGDISAAELGRRLGHTNNALVSMVLSRDRLIPPDAIDKWADKLGLDGDARVEFIVVANLQHSPPFIRELYRQLRAEIRERDEAFRRLERKQSEVLDQLDRRDRDNAELSRQLEACLKSRPSPAA